MIHVLIVEDQKMIREYLEQIVASRAGLRLVQAISDALDAEAICRTDRVDLVLMDVQTLHNHNGLAVGRRLKEQFPKIKVLIVTSLVDPNILAKAKAGAADSLWYKDHGEAAIMDVIERTMNGERVFPDSAPSVEIGRIESSDITPRQLDMLRLYIHGCSYSEIAARLHITSEGVRWNFKEMIAKAGFSCKADLITAALQSKLIVSLAEDFQ